MTGNGGESRRASTAYLILAHSRPEQLLRLVRVLTQESPLSDVVVHWDARADRLDRSIFAELGRVHFVDDAVCAEWGDFSIVEATLRALRVAIEQTACEWLVLLSGQDYPIAPLEQVERHLAAAGSAALIDPGTVASGRLAFRWRRDEATRLGRRYFFSYRRLRRTGPALPRWLRAALLRIAFVATEYQPLVSLWPMPEGLPWRVGVRRLRTPFSSELPCRVGSGWFSASRGCVERLLLRLERDPEIIRSYRGTIVPDESLFQTLICADDQIRIPSGNMRFHRWSSDDSPLHPKVLTSADLDDLLSCGKHFARKFDARIDSEVLDELDSHRGGRSL